jgi:hypothetical protein
LVRQAGGAGDPLGGHVLLLRRTGTRMQRRCIGQSVRIHIMHDGVRGFCAQANTGLESRPLARKQVCSPHALRRRADLAHWILIDDLSWVRRTGHPCSVSLARAAGIVCGGDGYCVAGNARSGKPGRTRGDTLGAPTGGSARYRRQGAAPSS